MNLGEPVELTTSETTIGVEYYTDEGLGETDLLTIGAHTAYSAFRALFANPNVESVRVTLLADWTDQLGNTERENTTIALFTRATADQVDWDGFEDRVALDNKVLFCVADESYIHPAIIVRLEDRGCLE